MNKYRYRLQLISYIEIVAASERDARDVLNAAVDRIFYTNDAMKSVNIHSQNIEMQHYEPVPENEGDEAD